MEGTKKIAIIGGGIVGLATAWQLSEKLKDKAVSIVVYEKENGLAFHQTGHNSGVIHSGIYYKPGSLRAINCNKGHKALIQFATQHKIPYDLCGKIIVATKNSEYSKLQDIYHNGIENKTPGIELIDEKAIKEIEPYCAGKKGIYVPSAGIIDFKTVTNKLSELFIANGGQVKLLSQVQAIIRTDTGYELHAQSEMQNFDGLIACGGAQSDRLAELAGINPGIRIVGFRGEYYELMNKERVRNLIYPVPDVRFPFLGVHFTRMIDGSIECGPNAVFAFHREGYQKSDFSWPDVKASLSYSGFWKLVANNLSYGMKEQWRSISKKAFYKSLLPLIPSLRIDELMPGRNGVRAIALDKDGHIIDDFKIVETQHSIQLLNAPSPAATASLAIGDTLSDSCILKLNL